MNEIRRVLLGCSEQLAVVVSIIFERISVAVKSSGSLDVSVDMNLNAIDSPILY